MDNQPVQPPISEQPNQQPIVTQPSQPSPSRLKSTPIMVLIFIVFLAASLYGVYAWQHKKTAQLQSQVSSLKSQVNKQSQTAKATSTPSPTATDPYSGWKSATLTYEKIKFKYPSDWTIKEQSTAANDPSTGNDYPMDSVSLTSPSGSVVSLNAGGMSEGDIVTFDKTPITFMGSSTNFLIVGIPAGESGKAPAQPDRGFIEFTSKNISTSKSTTTCYPNTTKKTCPLYDSFTYLPKGPYATPMSASQIESNPTFAQAKLILESMSY